MVQPQVMAGKAVPVVLVVRADVSRQDPGQQRELLPRPCQECRQSLWAISWRPQRGGPYRWSRHRSLLERMADSGAQHGATVPSGHRVCQTIASD